MISDKSTYNWHGEDEDGVFDEAIVLVHKGLTKKNKKIIEEIIEERILFFSVLHYSPFVFSGFPMLQIFLQASSAFFSPKMKTFGNLTAKNNAKKICPAW